jgi:hypothetical protein
MIFPVHGDSVMAINDLTSAIIWTIIRSRPRAGEYPEGFSIKPSRSSQAASAKIAFHNRSIFLSF